MKTLALATSLFARAAREQEQGFNLALLPSGASR